MSPVNPCWRRWSARLAAGLLLASALGCVDFGAEGESFCDRNPTTCDPDTTPPTLTAEAQSATRVVGTQTVTFSVTAQDAATPQLHFSWTVSAGTLGEQTDTGTTSQVSWTSPPCLPSGTSITVTLTVTDDAGLTAEKTFTLSANPCPTPAVVAGGEHSLALRQDGTLLAWGYNVQGQLGTGSPVVLSATPVQVPGLTALTAAAAGSQHSLAVRGDGTVWAWGYNLNGVLGVGSSSTSVPTPAQVTGLSSVKAVAAGSSHSLALHEDGTVSAWGTNSSGQLGDGSTTPRTAPVKVSGLTNVIAIQAGGSHSLALLGDGTVWAWGSNSNGQLGDGTTTPRTAPVKAVNLPKVTQLAGGTAYSLALAEGGTLWAWGENGSGQHGDGTTTEHNAPIQVASLSNVTAISAAIATSLALRSDGTVWAWGNNNNGQLGDGTTTQRGQPAQLNGLAAVTSIAVGGRHALALHENGTLSGWGETALGQVGDGVSSLRVSAVQAVMPSNIIATSISAGYEHSLLRDNNGLVWTWGKNDNGQLGNGTLVQGNTPARVFGLSSVLAVAGGGSHSLAMLNTGAVRAWGRNANGQLGNGNTTSSSSPVTVLMGTALPAPALTGITAISAGAAHSLALRGSDGTVWAWGSNTSGQLGNGENTQQATAVQVMAQSGGGTVALTGVKAIEAGGTHSAALKTNGTVWTWGFNFTGQLGNGTTVNSNIAVQVSGLTNISAIACGSSFCMALRMTDGTVWAWGHNVYGQLGNGETVNQLVPVQVTGLTGITAIAAGWASGMALGGDGTVWAWGNNLDGQLGDGTRTSRLVPVPLPGLSNVTALASGTSHTLALRSTSTVWSWGFNRNGQLGDNSPSVRLTPVQSTLP